MPVRGGSIVAVSDTSLLETKIGDANVQGADLRGAAIRDVDFSRANTFAAQFDKVLSQAPAAELAAAAQAPQMILSLMS